LLGTVLFVSLCSSWKTNLSQTRQDAPRKIDRA
jgi:hypothetical protein